MKRNLTPSQAPAQACFSLLALAGLLLLAACGSNTSTGGAAAPNATSNTTASSTPTSSGGRYGSGYGLYNFSGDSAPGQTTGEGFGGIWHVVTPSLT